MGFTTKFAHKYVISLLCLIDVLTHAADNVTLVNKMCGATFAPKVCISCIKSNSKDTLRDVDVIHQMLGCLRNDASKFLHDVKIETSRILVKTKARSYPPVMVNGARVAQDEVSMRKFNDAKTTIRQKVYDSLKTMNYSLNNHREQLSTGGWITFTWPPLLISGVSKVEADYKISDELLASVKA